MMTTRKFSDEVAGYCKQLLQGIFIPRDQLIKLIWRNVSSSISFNYSKYRAYNLFRYRYVFSSESVFFSLLSHWLSNIQTILLLSPSFSRATCLIA